MFPSSRGAPHYVRSPLFSTDDTVAPLAVFIAQQANNLDTRPQDGPGRARPPPAASFKNGA